MRRLSCCGIALMGCLAVFAGCGSSAPAPVTSGAPTASTPTMGTTDKTPTAPAVSTARPSTTDIAPGKAPGKTPTVAAAPVPQPGAKAKAVLEGFVTCMREHDINYPKLNLSGHGSAVKSSELDRSSPKFKAAKLVCAKSLAAELKRSGIGVSHAKSG